MPMLCCCRENIYSSGPITKIPAQAPILQFRRQIIVSGRTIFNQRLNNVYLARFYGIQQ